jgi:1,4-dihydroxy-2-naphthoate octaprenyltransferase
MFKINIRLPLFYLIAAAIVQFIFHREVNWLQNISICVIMVLIMMFYNWSKVPYEWKKDNKPE